ncbi:uncharacterized protein PV06_03904 [Exophiala oligosperma]|uniref:Mitochondrial thiamine pyrophosphate carrier 1 n=1 Tax=Exophiala oligosperma TaxID=215243 RepID=A0A0D2DRI2_9EURO|nr:uncharacterized protein PV06_03904 [Exophiala oligosperma]KIW45518.1 hypothetical protein PV06_03904 [Exophiala oligosperma]
MSSKPSGTIAMLAGGIAGASETVITYPAEFLKTRRQLPASSTGRPSSSIAIFRSVFNSQGIRGIYAGSPALIASNTAKGGVRFFSFESSKQVLERTIGSNNVFVNILAGLSGGIAESILVVTPAEVLKTQSIDMAAAGSRTTSTLTVARQVIRLHGPLGLWRGITPTLCKQATNSAVRFASFGAIKDWISTTSLAKRLNSAGLTLLAGSLSGAVTTYASMPFDNIKTRMQSTGSTHRSMLACGVSMLQQEGIKVFWRVTTPRLVRLMLSSGITFAVFDQITTFCALSNNGQRETSSLL